MAIVTTDNQHYTDIAAAIRSKNGTETQYKPSEMAAAIQAISGGSEPEPPDDGKTRLYITVPANAMPDRPPPRNKVPLYIQQTVANGVTIDWGDGTAPETLPGTGMVNTKHIYEKPGEYIISLDPIDKCELDFGGYSGETILGNYLSGYTALIKKVFFGKNVQELNRDSFKGLDNINEIRFSSGIKEIKNEVFYKCLSVTSLYLNEGLQTIASNAFYGDVNIGSVVIPKSVKEIGRNAFNWLASTTEFHFLSQTPPTLSGDDVFDYRADNIYYVPKGSLETYQKATNYAPIADKIQEEPA